MPEPKKILTAAEFTALRAESTETFPRRRNVSLNKGGAVDIYTGTKGTVVAVLRHVTLTTENEQTLTAEIEPLIAAEAKKAPPAPPKDSAQPSTADTEN